MTEVIGYIIVGLIVIVMGAAATYPLWKGDLDEINREYRE